MAFAGNRGDNYRKIRGNYIWSSLMVRYIHERPDWPRFLWDDRVLATALAALRYRQGRLIGRMEALGLSLQSEATFHTLTEDVIDTSAIEGEILDRAQVRSSLARRLGIDIGGLTPPDREVEGVVEMTLDATRHYDRPLTDERLFGWHAALFPSGRSGLHPIRVGAWRDDHTGPMQVVSGPAGRKRVHFEAPAAARLGREMAGFLDWLNADGGIDPVVKAAVAHLWFVTIHPFDDGNGRIARAVADMALARADGTTGRFYSVSAQIRRERRDYYAVLEATQKGDLAIDGWLSWFLGCLGRAIDGAEGVLASVLRKARFWDSHATMVFSERQRAMLTRLLDGFDGKLTTSKWAKICKCSEDTALRDILALVRRGILKRDAPGGRSTSYSLVD